MLRISFPRVLRLGAVALAAVSLAGLPGPCQAGPEEAGAAPKALPAGTVPLKHKAWRSFSIVLPQESFQLVPGGFDFRAAGGARFLATVEGEALAVDTDGDGTTDVRMEGKDGFLRLRTPAGFRYAARLVHTPNGWAYGPGGGLVGKIGDTRITLIDQNGNGSHGDVGVDALIVGRSRYATFLSRVVNLNGALHTIEVAADGRTLRHAPYTGPSGSLDGMRKHRADAKLLCSIVRSEDGRFSFDLANSASGLRVPSGRYLLHSGRLGLGDNLVQFRRGSAKVIEVKKDGATTLAWGAPLQAEFAFQRQGDEVQFDPQSVRYRGAAGEEYFGWHPCGKSPEFRILDARSATEIATAIFAGSG